MPALLDEGAGELDRFGVPGADSRELAVGLSFRTQRDFFYGTLRMLRDQRERGFELLRLALNEPRFDAEPVERIRAQVLARLQRETTSPTDIACKLWWATAFPDHPYGRPAERHARIGSARSMPRICALRAPRICARHAQGRRGRRHRRRGAGACPRSHVRRLARQGRAGAGRADALPAALGRRVGHRPRRAADGARPSAAPAFRATDPDYHPGLRRQSHPRRRHLLLAPLPRGAREAGPGLFGLLLSAAARPHVAADGRHRNAGRRAADSLAIIEAEIRRIADEGPTAQELEKTKSFSRAPIRCASIPRPRSPASCCRSRLTNSASTISASQQPHRCGHHGRRATRWPRRLVDGGLLVTVVARPHGLASTEPREARQLPPRATPLLSPAPYALCDMISTGLFGRMLRGSDRRGRLRQR